MLLGYQTDDTIYGESGDDIISGGFGKDTVLDGPGNDEVYGGADNDVFYSGAGADTFDGDDGATNLVSYRFRTDPVTATMDGSASGTTLLPEGDTIGSTVENLGGGSGNDTLTTAPPASWAP